MRGQACLELQDCSSAGGDVAGGAPSCRSSPAHPARPPPAVSWCSSWPPCTPSRTATALLPCLRLSISHPGGNRRDWWEERYISSVGTVSHHRQQQVLSTSLLHPSPSRTAVRLMDHCTSSPELDSQSRVFCLQAPEEILPSFAQLLAEHEHRTTKAVCKRRSRRAQATGRTAIQYMYESCAKEQAQLRGAGASCTTREEGGGGGWPGAGGDTSMASVTWRPGRSARLRRLQR